MWAECPSTAEPVGDAVRSPLPTVARDADDARQKRHCVPRRGVDPTGVGVVARFGPRCTNVVVTDR